MSKPPSDKVVRSCPGCEVTIQIRRQAVGRKVRCPQCRQIFVVAHSTAKSSHTQSSDQRSGSRGSHAAERQIRSPNGQERVPSGRVASRRVASRRGASRRGARNRRRTPWAVIGTGTVASCLVVAAAIIAFAAEDPVPSGPASQEVVGTDSAGHQIGSQQPEADDGDTAESTIFGTDWPSLSPAPREGTSDRPTVTSAESLTTAEPTPEFPEPALDSNIAAATADADPSGETSAPDSDDPVASVSRPPGHTLTAQREADVTVAETPLQERLIGRFLKKHCVRCHGAKEQHGSARFDTLDYAISDKLEALQYQDILDVLNGGDMPPEGERQPSNAELEEVIEELTEGLFDARKRLAANGGRVVMRRLNRREYATTIRHLFGFEPPATVIPPDEDVENFDTVGSRQHFTTAHFNEYYALAQDVLREGFKWAGVREAVQTRVQQPEDFWNSNFRRFIKDHEGKTHWKAVKLSKMRQVYLERPNIDSGVYLDEPLRHLSFGFGVDPRGTYRVRVKAGIVGEMAPFRRFIRIGFSEGANVALHIDGTPENPSESVVEVSPPLMGRKLGGRVAEDRSGGWLSGYVGFLWRSGEITKQEAQNQGLIWIDSFNVEGPFYPDGRSFFDTLLCPKEPTPGRKSAIVWNDSNARKLIEIFATEAFRRRKPKAQYIDGLAGYFRKQRLKGKAFQEAMVDTLAVVMASPGFLYLNEGADSRRSQATISPRENAIRLAYFLTSAPPDDQLYRLAATGKLSRDDVLHSEVSRLLEGSGSQRFAESLAGQWADFTRLDGISVSDKKYPRFTIGLRYSMKQEVVSFFHTLIEGNLPVRNLIASDFATVNAQLAVHYGIPDVTTNEFKPVKLPSGSHRGGFMTQGAFLVAGSNGERTSPPIRGMLLMSRLLNSPPPPPPPNVPELGAEVAGPVTNRKLVELHQTRAQCASCHRKMDTIGLALENFDLTGRYRTDEVVERQKIPVQISGTMPGGKRFDSFSKFQAMMLNHEEDLARNMVESLLVYALGRDIEFTDDPHIESIMDQIRPDGFRMRDMILAVARSPLFQKN